MLEELPLLFRGEFVIERDEHAAAIENRAGGNQPLGLIGHDDGCAVVGLEACVLQSLGQKLCALFEIAISEALFLAASIRFDEANLRSKLVERVLQRGPDGLIAGQVKHKARRLATEAQRPRSEAS